MTDRQLINLAEQASRNAYVPYSHFAVGAALECRDGTVCSYFLNGRITFRDGHIARWRQCLRFVMWNVVSLGVSEVMIGLLTHFGLNPYIAKVGVTLEVALFNYFGYKYIVFAVPKQTEGEQDHDRSSTD